MAGMAQLKRKAWGDMRAIREAVSDVKAQV